MRNACSGDIACVHSRVCKHAHAPFLCLAMYIDEAMMSLNMGSYNWLVIVHVDSIADISH